MVHKYYLRNTNNIDFLIEDNAFEVRDGVVFTRFEFPIKYRGTPVNWVTMNDFEKKILLQYLCVPTKGEIPIMPIEPLIVMKLIAGRHKDRTDIIELLKISPVFQIEVVESFVETNLPSQLKLFQELVLCAESEQ